MVTSHKKHVSFILYRKEVWEYKHLQFCLSWRETWFPAVRRDLVFKRSETNFWGDLRNLEGQNSGGIWTITIQINHQLDATISPILYLTFMYSSTCFGRPHAHHQELSNCSSSLWFYHWSVVIAVLVARVRAGSQPARPRAKALISPRSCYCSCWAPDDGREDARKMLSCT